MGSRPGMRAVSTQRFWVLSVCPAGCVLRNLSSSVWTARGMWEVKCSVRDNLSPWLGCWLTVSRTHLQLGALFSSRVVMLQAGYQLDLFLDALYSVKERSFFAVGSLERVTVRHLGVCNCFLPIPLCKKRKRENNNNNNNKWKQQRRNFSSLDNVKRKYYFTNTLQCTYIH